MIKKLDLKILIFLLVNIAYIFIIGVLNDFLSPYVYLILPAIFIIAPAKYLGFGGMVFVVVFSALMSEIYLPLPTGISAVIWLLAAVCARFISSGTERVDTLWAIYITQITNFLIIFVYALILPNNTADFLTYVTRVACDTGASAFLLLFVSKFTVEFPMLITQLINLEVVSYDDV